MIKALSVFLPTYNERGNIEKVTSKVKEVLGKVAEKWEIIIVDDGSSDDTPAVVDEIAKKDQRIRVIHHKSNRGYGGALKTGFESAKYPWVAFMDSDGQFDFGEIEKFIAKKDEADLILGYRKNRADSFARKVFTFGWSTLARIVLGLRAKDYSCGFKMIKRSVYEKIQPLVGEEKVTQIEMLVKARKKEFRFSEVGVNHYPRISGSPTGAKLKVVLKSIIDLFGLWGKLHGVTRKELLFLLIILAVGAFFRLYRISEYMHFLGDEGRDMIIVRRFLTEAHPPLIGPGTSVGTMYLGPLYYYMMAPMVFLFNFSPIGPAVMVALLGVATVLLTWWVGREWFSKSAGLIAAGLYAISPTVIVYSQSSWNPNIMPFFALLSIYSIWRVWKYKQYKWFVVTGISYAFVLQSHYFGVLLLPVLFLFWLVSRVPVRYTIYAISLFLFLMSPLLIFDLRHNWQNFNSMKSFAVGSGGSFGGPVFGLANFVPTFINSITRLLAGRNETVGLVVAVILAAGIIWLILKRKMNWLLLTWFLIGIFGLSLYKGSKLDHYMGFIFPAPFLLLGALTSKLNKYIALAGVLVLVVVNLLNNPLRSEPNRQMVRSRQVATFIWQKAEGERFNLATIGGSRDSYQYFLLLWGARVVDADPNSVPLTVTDQLFIVCELPKEKCDPLHDPSAWIMNFGWSKIAQSWEVGGVNLYKLTHGK